MATWHGNLSPVHRCTKSLVESPMEYVLCGFVSRTPKWATPAHPHKKKHLKLFWERPFLGFSLHFAELLCVLELFLKLGLPLVSSD